jgi:hypothetical protein
MFYMLYYISIYMSMSHFIERKVYKIKRVSSLELDTLAIEN